MKRELRPAHSTARGRDHDALAVALYAAWCRSDDGGQAPDGRQFPKWSALSNAEQRRWSGAAKLALGLAEGDADALGNHAYYLAEQAGAYPWTGDSLPPAAVAPEFEHVPPVPTDTLAIAMHAAMCIAERQEKHAPMWPTLKRVLARTRGSHFPPPSQQFLRNIHPAIELAQLAITDPRAAHEAVNDLCLLVLPMRASDAPTE